jgi:FixJ family two-component response regulator
MPEMGGRLLSERLAAMIPGIKVIFISGYTDDAVVRHGVLEAGVAFLQKPFTTAALGKKVRDVLDSSAETWNQKRMARAEAQRTEAFC